MPKWASGPVGHPSYWKRAKKELSAADPVMAGIIKSCGRGGLTGHGDAFVTLARAIVAQQISVRAADSIWNRLDEAVGGISPDHVAARDEAELHAAGLTRRKASYIRDMAVAFIDGDIAPSMWGEKDDEGVIAGLIELRGIGRWTAEMFLIFHLLRPDILPLDDIGLIRACERHYADGQDMARDEIEKLARRWQPWRSVATWYLWRSLDPTAVAY
ncbi:MAG: DNA-3-methyladenine glycosylase 2 family protein [Alphaproteobacteria bacterium]|jgi:DNA-3-methyladenine glycosylase II|nr:DNA-3-methyladenine glycosylase 2 family protein [Alphaproteobacteria bacterium]MDP6644384.1 DNA-3-methyladenine glycosylase 2 family protein [Rhodospirillales bacterium]MDP6818659.1 DNA-3-methyladenine glycosylase 2 family protein [Alphaproteobacteria bacterium]|tara:strand:+ start:57 stop:701 length:645 start_codon:yes stop_codon:yes gene_type:complete